MKRGRARDLPRDFRCRKPRRPLHRWEDPAGIGSFPPAPPHQARPLGTDECGCSQKDPKGPAQHLWAEQSVQAAAASAAGSQGRLQPSSLGQSPTRRCRPASYHSLTIFLTMPFCLARHLKRSRRLPRGKWAAGVKGREPLTLEGQEAFGGSKRVTRNE